MMPGAAASLGAVGVTVALAAALAAVAGAAVHGQRLAGAADAAALAAADAVSGAVSGEPCARAAEIAATAGAQISACELEGLIATVTVSAPFIGFAASAKARAGPPPAKIR